MKRVLVTGASGFIGHRLLRRLADEGQEQLFAVTSRAGGMEAPEGVLVERLDLLDAAAVKSLIERIRPDACVHLAWDQGDGYRGSCSNYRWLAASIQLFTEFEQAGGRQFLFAGSSAEYEDRAGSMAETPRVQPMSLYGRCKKSASELFLSSGCGTLVQVARCFTVYGPGDTHRFGAIPAAVCTLLRGGTFSCRSPRTIRDYIYIDDAVEAVLRLLRSDYRGAVNIGSGIPRSMREVFLEIGGQLNCLERISFNGEAGRETMLVSDNAVLQHELGFVPQTDFSEGIARTIAYWRTQLGAETCET